VLTEPEAQTITRALGIGLPRMTVVATADEASGVDLPGERLVVKAVGPAHKTELGGVRVAANSPAAIVNAVRLIAASAAGTTPESFLVAEFVDHDPANEVLAGVRWTDAFGPVVSIGPGGVTAGLGLAPAIVARATSDRIDATLASAPGTRSLTEGSRGTRAVARPSQLAALAVDLLTLGETTMPHDLVEFEINPLVFTSAGAIALDALAVLGRGKADTPRRPPPPEGILQQLRPRSIAVIGVSERMNPGRVILHNLLAAGFPADRIAVIKPGVTVVDGCRAVPSLSALDEPVDLLVVALTASAVPELMDEVIASGFARSVILIPGGLGERPGTEPEARRLAESIATARRAGRSAPVVTGPNSMGIRSVPGSYDATFIPAERMTPAPAKGAPLALIAQSGAFTLSRLDRLPWLRPRYVVTVGNQLDLTIGNYLDHFAGDPEVAIVACYLEGFRPGDGDRMLRAAARLRARGGVLIWYRGGRTVAGARSAATHTAAVASDDAVARALGETVGILTADSLDDFDDLLRLAVLLHQKAHTGRRLAVVSNAGFECVAAADNLGTLELTEFAPATRSRLVEILDNAGLGGITGAGNPLDLTPSAGDEAFAAAAEAALDDPGVDLAVIGCVPFTPELRTLPADVDDPGSLPGRLAALAGHRTPWVAVVDGGRRYDPMAGEIEEAGVPVIRSMDRAIRLVAKFAITRQRGAGG